MTIAKEIESRIKDAQSGSTFIISDFSDIANYDTARKSLARLEKSRIVKKITRGIYYKPQFSKLLHEYIAPDVNSVAYAIARNFSWSITPSGETALNRIGLSPQVPARHSYISSGPYRKYRIGNTQIEFLHRANKELNEMSEKTMLIIQAIKAIDQNHINEYIPKLKLLLTSEEKRKLLSEGQRTTSWIYNAIKEISRENSNVSNS